MSERERVTGHSSRSQRNTAGLNQSSEGGLRKFRMDKISAVKQQVSQLRYFRSEDKNSPGSPDKESSQKNNPDSESISRNPVLHRRMSVASPVLSECKSMVRTGERNSHFKTITTNKFSLHTLSKPVFVEAPSPEPSPEREEDEEEETEEEKAAVTKDDEEEGGEPSTSQESEETTSTRKLLKDFRSTKMKKSKSGESLAEELPLVSVSTKTLINNMKRALNSPEGDDDDQDRNMASNSSSGDQGDEDITEADVKEERGESSSSEEPPGDTSLKRSVNNLKRMLSSSDLDQDSPVIRIKTLKRARLVTTSDEDEDKDEDDDDDPSVKNKQLNGHNTSDSEPMPDGASIDKFLDMWETVYTYIPKMEFLDIFRAHDWNVKNTMIKLGQLNKEYKVWQRQQKVEEELTRKKEAAVKREELKKFKQAGRDMEAVARRSMKEKLKAQKESIRTKPSHKNMDAAELEEEEGDDYQFGGAKVYNSESDDEDEEGVDEDDTRLKGDRDLVLQFFNDATVSELSCLYGCSKKKAELIFRQRPFKDWTQIVKKLKKTKQVSPDILNQAKTILHVRNTVQKLMKRCENIAKDMQYIVSNIVSGEEDAGISKQPEILNPEMQLKNYQLIGLNWLVLMHQQGLNGVLADEMGLGKTVQAIAFLAYIKEVEAPEAFSLIVVPSSTLENWARELELWCPDLGVLCYHGSQEDRRAIRAEIINDTLEDPPDIILTTYNMVTTSTDDRALFKKLRFHTLILDEAHMLKNMASMRYENLMKIKTQRRVLLTGTPLQNNLVELMSILIYVMPQLFDSKREELKRVFTMFPKSDTGNQSLFERERIDQAKRIMKPFFLRRLKCDVLKDLPVKTEEIIIVSMSERQKKIYKERVSSFSKKARQQQVNVEQLNMKQLTELEELEATGVSSSPKKKKENQKDSSSNMVMALRKIANHPLLTREFYTDDKITAISKILKRTSHQDSVLEYIIEDFQVMSDFEIYSTCQYYPAIKQYRLPEEFITTSGKLEQLDILLPQLKKEGARVLLFSQFVIVLNILEKYIKIRGHRFVRFDGSTQVSERQELIDQFTEDEGIFLFLLSTRAGGLGVNLTAANTVILHDIDFNPYNDKQAEDRCHRVGQTRPVKIFRLVSKGTIEEGMLQIGKDKLQLERDVTALEEDIHRRSDVLSLLKDTLGLGKAESDTQDDSSD